MEFSNFICFWEHPRGQIHPFFGRKAFVASRQMVARMLWQSMKNSRNQLNGNSHFANAMGNGGCEEFSAAAAISIPGSRCPNNVQESIENRAWRRRPEHRSPQRGLLHGDQ